MSQRPKFWSWYYFVGVKLVHYSVNEKGEKGGHFPQNHLFHVGINTEIRMELESSFVMFGY